MYNLYQEGRWSRCQSDLYTFYVGLKQSNSVSFIYQLSCLSRGERAKEILLSNLLKLVFTQEPKPNSFLSSFSTFYCYILKIMNVTIFMEVQLIAKISVKYIITRVSYKWFPSVAGLPNLCSVKVETIVTPKDPFI